MANKRELKKQIKYICGDLAAECIMAREFIDGIDSDKMNNIIFDIANLQERSLKNCTFSFEKTPSSFETPYLYHLSSRKYFHQAYKSFYDEFNKHVADIVKSMNSLLSEEQKQINKAIANSKAE